MTTQQIEQKLFKLLDTCPSLVNNKNNNNNNNNVNKNIIIDYSNKIGRYNSFGNGSGTIDNVTIGRYNLLIKENIMEVGSTLRCQSKYENLANENIIFVNYQPYCAEEIIKGAGKMINGIYKKIEDIQIRDVEYYGVRGVKIRFKVKRLDIYDPFEFKINDENGKYNWQSLRKDVPDASLHTIGSMGKISKDNACKDVINHIKINYAIKIQRWFRNIQKSSKEKMDYQQYSIKQLKAIIKLKKMEEKKQNETTLKQHILTLTTSPDFKPPKKKYFVRWLKTNIFDDKRFCEKKANPTHTPKSVKLENPTNWFWCPYLLKQGDENKCCNKAKATSRGIYNHMENCRHKHKGLHSTATLENRDIGTKKSPKKGNVYIMLAPVGAKNTEV